MTTKFNSCPSYLKIGPYALGYDYSEIADSLSDWLAALKGDPYDADGNHVVPRLVTEFDFVRVSNSMAVANGVAPKPRSTKTKKVGRRYARLRCVHPSC